MRIIYVALVVLKGWISEHLDIEGAYLYAKLTELIYIEQPEGFIKRGKENFVWNWNGCSMVCIKQEESGSWNWMVLLLNWALLKYKNVIAFIVLSQKW